MATDGGRRRRKISPASGEEQRRGAWVRARARSAQPPDGRARRDHRATRDPQCCRRPRVIGGCGHWEGERGGRARRREPSPCCTAHTPHHQPSLAQLAPPRTHNQRRQCARPMHRARGRRHRRRAPRESEEGRALHGRTRARNRGARSNRQPQNSPLLSPLDPIARSRSLALNLPPSGRAPRRTWWPWRRPSGGQWPWPRRRSSCREPLWFFFSRLGEEGGAQKKVALFLVGCAYVRIWER